MASELEKIGIEQRNKQVPKNIYNNESDSNKYGVTHSRAISDDKTPVNGKGTGVFLDTYNGGSKVDILGNPLIPGSGRNKNMIVNEFNSDKPYTAPDTSQNKGQIIIE